MSWFCFSLFTISHFLQLTKTYSSILALKGAIVIFLSPAHHTLFLSVVITMAFGGEDRQHWTGLYSVIWARNTRSTSVIVVSSENCSETRGGVSDEASLFLVHTNTQIPFPYCSPILKGSKSMHLCIEGVLWILLMHLSHSNRRLKWFYVSLHYYSCWAGQRWWWGLFCQP